MSRKINPKKELDELIRAGYDWNSDNNCIHCRNTGMPCYDGCIDFDFISEEYYYGEIDY